MFQKYENIWKGGKKQKNTEKKYKNTKKDLEIEELQKLVLSVSLWETEIKKKKNVCANKTSLSG